MNSGMRGFIVFGLFDSDLRRSISAVLSENRAVVKAAIIFSITKILTYQRVVLAGRRRNSYKNACLQHSVFPGGHPSKY